MGVSGLHAGKALVRLGCMTPLEAEDEGGYRRTGRRTPALEDDGGGRVWRRGSELWVLPLPSMGLCRQARLGPLCQALGAPGEVRPGN